MANLKLGPMWMKLWNWDTIKSSQFYESTLSKITLSFKLSRSVKVKGFSKSCAFSNFTFYNHLFFDERHKQLCMMNISFIQRGRYSFNKPANSCLKYFIFHFTQNISLLNIKTLRYLDLFSIIGVYIYVCIWCIWWGVYLSI